MSRKILGVSRSVCFSPNSVERDAAIFQGVASVLRSHGWEVETVSEDDFVSAAGYAAVFSMARSERTLCLLAAAEEQGLPVINSAKALLSATRLRLTEIFEREGIPVPLSPVVFRKDGTQLQAVSRTNGGKEYRFPLWLKRSGACAQSAGDVCFVEDEAALTRALEKYAARGIDEVLASEHLTGDLVKFYGVEGTAFFYAYYPTADNAFSKFGLEKINGMPSGYPLDLAALKRCADHAAELCVLPVYGGDAVVDAEGHFRIIDFNDWPSYSRCGEEAAAAISRKLEQQLSGEPSE